MPSPNNRYRRGVDTNSRDAYAAAGLELRQREAASREETSDESMALRRKQLELDQVKSAWELHKYNTEIDLQKRALEEGIRFQKALAHINEADPMYEEHIAALHGALPYGVKDPAVKEALAIKNAARAETMKALTAFQKDGIDLNDPRFHVRDQNGWFRGMKWDALGMEQRNRRLAAVAETAKGLGSPTTAASISLPDGSTLRGTIETPQGRINKAVAGGVIDPAEAARLGVTAKSTDPADLQRVDMRLAEAAGKQAVQDRTLKQQTFGARLDKQRTDLLAIRARLAAQADTVDKEALKLLDDNITALDSQIKERDAAVTAPAKDSNVEDVFGKDDEPPAK